jgi:hypothetical protein
MSGVSRSSARTLQVNRIEEMGRHILVDAVLEASQVEVGISRKETESNAGSIGESQTGSESERETGFGEIKRIRSNVSDQQGDHD